MAMKSIRRAFRANSLFLKLIWQESKPYYVFYVFLVIMQSAFSLLWVMVPQWFLGSLLNDKNMG